VLSIAVDVQGSAVVRPYVEKAEVTFPVLVDTADVFGRAFALKAIPVSFLVDETGIIRLRGGGPTPELLKQIEAVLTEPLTNVRGRASPLPGARSKSELEKLIAKNPDDWQARLALAQQLQSESQFSEAVAQCEIAAALRPDESAVYFTWGLILLNQKQQPPALKKLKQARDLAPDNWRIRKQIWAIEHPDRFYNGRSPDFGWQKEQLAREKAGK
jgi:tetratricopeptide (TPR) repeat protein